MRIVADIWFLVDDDGSSQKSLGVSSSVLSFFPVPKAVGVRFVGSSDADPIKYDAEISSKHSGYHLPQISVWPF